MSRSTFFLPTKSWFLIIVPLILFLTGYVLLRSNHFSNDNQYIKAITSTIARSTESTINVINETSKAQYIKAITSTIARSTESTINVIKETSKAYEDGFQWSVKDFLKPTAFEYLAPIHSFKEVDKTRNRTERVRAYAELFRTGYGLKPFTTEDNKKAWNENGVVYRPMRENLRLMSSHPQIPTRHPTDFEYYVPFDEKQFYPNGKAPSSADEAKPKIILWYDVIGYVSQMSNLEPLRMCPDFPCRITTNKKYTEESSAMLFEGTVLSASPPQRRPEQVFVFHYTETLPKPGDKRFTKLANPPWRNAFNWTMSFRMNADIQSYYGIMRKRPEPLEKDYTAIVARKSKMVATLISHCRTASLREEYIRRLKQYIDVDVYGGCGPYRCPRGDDVHCGEMIDSKYKFYLSFENAVCDEYITEKFFRYMSLDTVVVARGGGTYLQHVPRGTFINAADFSSSKELAKYLIYLDKHPPEYEAILREKAKFVSLYEAWYHTANNHVTYVHYHYEAIPLCRICHRLWNLESHSKTIPDIKTWLYNFTCIDPHTFL